MNKTSKPTSGHAEGKTDKNMEKWRKKKESFRKYFAFKIKPVFWDSCFAVSSDILFWMAEAEPLSYLYNSKYRAQQRFSPIAFHTEWKVLTPTTPESRAVSHRIFVLLLPYLQLAAILSSPGRSKDIHAILSGLLKPVYLPLEMENRNNLTDTMSTMLVPGNQH